MSNFRVLKADFIEGLETKRNLLSGGAFEKGDVNGWVRYVDAAQSRPEDGTGGSPSSAFTLTKDSSGYIDGDGSILITKNNTNTQGRGISKDFVVGPQSQGRVMVVEFDYRIIATGYQGGSETTDSDLIVYLRRLTSTARNVEPIGFKLGGAVDNFVYKYKGTFQTDVDSGGSALDYRIMIHCATTSTTAYTVAFDNFKIYEQAFLTGSNDTDWKSYTPTIEGFGTPSAVAGFYRQAGDTVELQVNFTSGSTTATEARVGLPPGLSTDASKHGSTKTIVGAYALDVATGIFGTVLGESINSTYVTLGIQGASNAGLASVNGNALVGSGVGISLFCRIPVAGWAGSGTIIGPDDARSCVFSAQFTPGQIIPDSTVTELTIGTVLADNMAIKVGNSVQLKVGGQYFIEGAVGYDANGTGARAFYIESSPDNSTWTQIRSQGVKAIGGGVDTIGCALLYTFVAGTYLRFTTFQNTGVSHTIENVAERNHVNIFKVNSAQGVSAGEKIVAVGTVNTITNFTNAVVTFPTKIIDTHNALSSGVFTAPRADFYDYSVFMTSSSGTTVSFYLQKNSTNYRYCFTNGSNQMNGMTGKIYLLTGETLSVVTNGSVTTDDTGPSENSSFCVSSIG